MAKFEAREGKFDVKGARIAIVAARFNDSIVERLVTGASETLSEHGLKSKNITTLRVPGAFEIPVAAQALAATGNFAAIIALGAVIRGGTPHFEYVAGECASGAMQVALEHAIPVAFGVLTVDDVAQAMQRAGGSEGNKGHEAALAALEMVHILRSIKRL